MSAFFSNFHFLRPWWLLALVALPLLWRQFARHRADGGGWREAVDAHLLEHLLVSGDGAKPSAWPARLAGAAWVVGALALAGPAWERLPEPLYQNRAVRVFALELSSSMLAQDVKPSRYERARFKLDDMLQHTGDGQTALIAFAGDAFVVAPLTDDVNTVLNLVDALDPSVMPVQGNNTARAIDSGVELVRQAGARNGEIVLLVDGVDDGAVAAARRAAAAGVHVSVFGIGSAQGAPVPLAQGGFLKNAAGEIVLPKVDASALAAVAAAGEGRYVEYTSDTADIDRMLDKPAWNAAQRSDVAASTTRFRDRGPWLVLLLVPLAAAGFRRGWLMLLLVCLFAQSRPAAAFSWSDLWRRPDQQALSELQAGRAQQAQALARSPDLRGAAAYRAGDFAAAERDFAGLDNANAQYNRGNALAKQGRYEDAIAAYAQALQRDPKMADAAANKKAVEDWLKRQQQQGSQSQNSQDHQGKQQQQGGQGSSSGDDGQKQQDQNRGSQQQGDQQQSDAGKSGENQQQSSDGARGSQQQQPGQDAQQNGTENESSTARDAERQAQEQFRQNMDQAVKNQGDRGQRETQPMRLGANSDGQPKDERQQALEQLIERVPDDPGGLLRRKFQLEYQRRQARGGGG